MKKRHFVEPPAPAAAASPDPWSNRVGSPSGFGGGGQVESYEDEALVQAHAWGCWKVRTDRYSPDYATWRARMQRRQATGASVDCGEKKDEWGTAATPPADTGKAETEHGGSSWFKESVEKERRARPDCYGIVSDSTAADCERDPWAAGREKKGPVATEAPRTRDDQWGTGVESATQEGKSQRSSEESQDGYAKALADTLGSDQTVTSTDSDYMAALRNMETKDAEWKAREEAERRRVEEERRAKEVAEIRRLEEERRAGEIAERRRIEAEMRTSRPARRYRSSSGGGVSSRPSRTEEPRSRSSRSTGCVSSPRGGCGTR